MGTGTHGCATALYTVLPLAIGSSLVQVFFFRVVSTSCIPYYNVFKYKVFRQILIHIRIHIDNIHGYICGTRGNML